MTNEATTQTNKGTPATCWKCGELISTISPTFPYCRPCHQTANQKLCAAAKEAYCEDAHLGS
jgi:hypothetical protein